MRTVLAAFLTGSLLCSPALAAGQPSAGNAPAPAPVKPVPAKPAARIAFRAPANRPVDYGEMRCAFAIRHRDMLDSQIITWASGFIEGYSRQAGLPSRIVDEITDPGYVRTHIRGYCLKYRSRSVGAAVLATARRGHRAEPATVAPDARPGPGKQPASKASPASP